MTLYYLIKYKYSFSIFSYLRLILQPFIQPTQPIAIYGQSCVEILGLLQVTSLIKYTEVHRYAISGFGHHLAVQLESSGCVVYAGCLLPDGDGARKLREIKSKRMHVIHLDVTDDSHVSNAVDYVEKHSSTKGLSATIFLKQSNTVCQFQCPMFAEL